MIESYPMAVIFDYSVLIDPYEIRLNYKENT